MANVDDHPIWKYFNVPEGGKCDSTVDKHLQDDAEEGGSCGTRFLPTRTSTYCIMGRLLEECKSKTENTLKDVKESWSEIGVSIACDGWTDGEGRPQLNILAVNSRASVFLFGVDCGTDKKGADYIAKHLKTAIVEVGAENVVGLLMDGASANISAASIVAQEYPKVLWIRCAAHALSLLMKDIGELNWAKPTIEEAQQLISTLKNAQWITGHFREDSLKVLKTAGIRFGTNYIALERLILVRRTLKKMVSTKGFKDYMKGRPKLRVARGTIKRPGFWKGVEQVVVVLKPIYMMLRQVDGNQEVMGKMWENNINCPLYVVGRILYPPNQYEKIFGPDRECTKVFKQFVRDYYKGETVKMGNVLSPMATVVETEILTYTRGTGEIGEQKAKDEHILIKEGHLDPVQWWVMNGSDCPHLTKLACKILKQCVSASTCETNWGVWESIHTARRNRLGPKRLADLVYVSHNYHTVKKLDEDFAKKMMVTALPMIREEPKDGYEPLDEDDDIQDEAYLDISTVDESEDEPDDESEDESSDSE
ncbi:hypothetical protein CLOM_g5530 [Closterium sp. NIES-68]|nr:hypothetical protein CLOM_g5530 [Closterium sp. NIES-68]